MSVDLRIADALTRGSLHEVKPAVGEPLKRFMLISTPLHRLLYGPWKSIEAADRLTSLRADLEEFVSEGIVSMHLAPRSAKKGTAARDAYVGLLDPAGAGIFDIRSRDPRPGLRVLGAFAKVDMFIAFSCHPRSRKVAWLPNRQPLLERDSKAWRAAINDCHDQWRKIVGADVQPVAGSTPSAFVSRNAPLV
jgi:hypothetical protein